MFFRTKTAPNRVGLKVQLVESRRSDDRIEQRVIRHLGTAHNDEEMARLERDAEYEKARLREEQQPGLFSIEVMAEMAIKSKEEKRRKKLAKEAPLRLSRKTLEEKRVVTGIHEICGEAYREIGLQHILPQQRFQASSEALLHIVMARIACPDSKRGSVRELKQRFDVGLSDKAVFRMMDLLDETRIDQIRARVGKASRALLPERTPVVCFDCTALSFETEKEDDLRRKGYSKDGKRSESQLLLAFLVSREGLPFCYDVMAGNTWEGCSLAPLMRKTLRLLQTDRMVCVADRGMFSRENLAALDELGIGFVVGARLRSLPRSLQEEILRLEDYRPMEGDDGRMVAELEHRGRRLIVTWCPERAERDRRVRQEALARVERRLSRSDNPKDLLSNASLKRYVSVKGEARMVDEDKIANEARWDGLSGIETNQWEVPVSEALSQYSGLWQVEESFRIAKSDLRIRPIFHWTEARIHAHIATCYIAYACLRLLAFRLSARGFRMSPKAIRRALMSLEVSHLKDTVSGKRFRVPSNPTPDAVKIYTAMGKTLDRYISEVD